MGIEERNPAAAAQAVNRNATGLALVSIGFCLIVATIAADAVGPVRSCNCWSALYSPIFAINTVGHVASVVMVFLGGKRMDW